MMDLDLKSHFSNNFNLLPKILSWDFVWFLVFSLYISFTCTSLTHPHWTLSLKSPLWLELLEVLMVIFSFIQITWFELSWQRKWNRKISRKAVLITQVNKMIDSMK